MKSQWKGAWESKSGFQNKVGKWVEKFRLVGMEGSGEQRSWQHCPDRSVTQYLPVHSSFRWATAHLKQTKVLPSTLQLPRARLPWSSEQRSTGASFKPHHSKESPEDARPGGKTMNVWQMGVVHLQSVSSISIPKQIVIELLLICICLNERKTRHFFRHSSTGT